MTSTPWRDRQWLIDNLNRHGGYYKIPGSGGSGAASKLAREIGCNQSTISTWAHRHGLEPIDTTPPPPLIPIESKEWVLSGDFGVSSDWHVPAVRYDIMERMLDDGAKHGLTRHIIAGDLTNQDALSEHEEKQKGAEFDVEMEHLNYAMDRALDLVDEIWVTLGNHDRHIKRKTKQNLDKSLRMILSNLSREKLDRIKVSERDYVLVKTEQGIWRVCHTYSYSKIPLHYPNQLALKWEQHIAAGHRHHLAQGFATNGRMLCELGGLMDIERLAYLHRFSNALPKMQNGYGMLINGKMRCPMLYS